jgi:hypothetical protein
MAIDDPGRQPFAAHCMATCPAGNPGSCAMGPVPEKKRLVVESVSGVLPCQTSGTLYSMLLSAPSFTLFMVPTLIYDGSFPPTSDVITPPTRFAFTSSLTNRCSLRL